MRLRLLNWWTSRSAILLDPETGSVEVEQKDTSFGFLRKSAPALALVWKEGTQLEEFIANLERDTGLPGPFDGAVARLGGTRLGICLHEGQPKLVIGSRLVPIDRSMSARATTTRFRQRLEIRSASNTVFGASYWRPWPSVFMDWLQPGPDMAELRDFGSWLAARVRALAQVPSAE